MASGQGVSTAVMRTRKIISHCTVLTKYLFVFIRNLEYFIIHICEHEIDGEIFIQYDAATGSHERQLPEKSCSSIRHSDRNHRFRNCTSTRGFFVPERATILFGDPRWSAHWNCLFDTSRKIRMTSATNSTQQSRVTVARSANEVEGTLQCGGTPAVGRTELA